MRPHTRRLSFRLASKVSRGPSRDGAGDPGYALLVMMMMVTILLISLTAALPSVYTAEKREQEEELIFRGNQYARAIMLFRQRFNRFPTSVKELSQTNGMRFLRHAYKDPMSRNGRWRFIHANAAGALLDSRTVGAQGVKPGAQRSNIFNEPTGSIGESQQDSSFGFGVKPEDQEEADAFEKALEEEAKEESMVPNSNVQGAFIAGVASSSRKKSIRVWNKHTRYDEWEFLGIPVNVVGAQPGMSPMGAPAQTQPSFQEPRMPPLTEGPVSNQ